MLTREALSPSVPAWQVITSLVVFAMLYLVVATIALRLIFRYAKAGPRLTTPLRPRRPKRRPSN
jgi:cytochrome d ubiquinol oxidase subunit I